MRGQIKTTQIQSELDKIYFIFKKHAEQYYERTMDDLYIQVTKLTGLWC